MAFDTTIFDGLRTAVGATLHYVKLSSPGGTAIAAILKASTRADAVAGAGLDSSSAGRALVKTDDFAMPANRKLYWSRDASTYTAARIVSAQTLADSVTALEYESIARGVANG